MKYITVSVPVNEDQVLSMMKVHDINVVSAVTKIAVQNMKSGYGKINNASLIEVTHAIEALNKPAVVNLSLQKFIDTYKPLSANKYRLDETITREDRILDYYSFGTKKEVSILFDQPKSKIESYLWVIIVEHADNEVTVTVRPYVVGITLTKYQDPLGYVVTEEPHNDKNIIVTISTQ
jgi:hypothetical protein